MEHIQESASEGHRYQYVHRSSFQYMEIMTNSDKNQYEDIADVRTLDSKEEQ